MEPTDLKNTFKSNMKQMFVGGRIMHVFIFSLRDLQWIYNTFLIKKKSNLNIIFKMTPPNILKL